MNNILYEYKLYFDIFDIDKMHEIDLFDKLYSYVLQMKTSTDLVLKYRVADNELFNTIPSEDVIKCCKSAIDNVTREFRYTTTPLSFGQPPLDMFLILYEPMIQKMVKKINGDWPALEMEDLAQLCRLCCVDLYNKGYYLHKSLIWTTFKNAVLTEIRPLKRRANVVSIYETDHDLSSDDKPLRIIDSLVDTQSLWDEEDRQNSEINSLIFKEIKDIIIRRIGSRRFDALFRDYKNNHTTNQSRQLLHQIKAYLRSLGITREYFNNKYGN